MQLNASKQMCVEGASAQRRIEGCSPCDAGPYARGHFPTHDRMHATEVADIPAVRVYDATKRPQPIP